ncbi:response regulator transcription factor [Microbulbifer litoralis]|uniref:response regulator transcription factor n=1 Tax=Microbulbifer litoralis TaxID=2933965 RepID=UPI002027FA23
MNPLKILLIEDNPTLARQTGEFLQAHGWQIDFAHNGRLGQQLALEQVYDLVILDLGLPDIDGLEVCQRIKERAPVNMPVLMLTARDAFTDKAQGFESGTDDYLCKPFDPRELALRCKALTRRNRLYQSDRVCVGELTIHRRGHCAERAGQRLHLTAIGFRILTLLAEAHPEPLSRSAITHHIWGDDPPETDALKSHIYSLRQALDRPFPSAMLKTITSLGYQLEAPDADR